MITKEKSFSSDVSLTTFSFPLKESTKCGKNKMYLKIRVITLFFCKRSEYNNTARECLTETVGFTLGETLV